MLIESYKQMGYKAEAAELTAETLVPANYGSVWSECDIMDESTYNARKPRRASYSAMQGIGGTAIGKVTGSFEPRPSGTNGTAPDWYAIAAAAGGTVATDNVTFGAEGVTSAIIGTAATFKYRDGVYEHVSAGTRISKLRFFAKNGESWMCEVEGTGRYSKAVEDEFIAGAHPTTGLGNPFLGMACSIGSFSGSVSSAEISIENTVTPTPDGTHSSGFGRNIITTQACMIRASVIEDGAVDWRNAYRNDSRAAPLAVSLQMSKGAAGNVLTWTGSIALIEQPTIEYMDGVGYVTVVGEFVSDDADPCLTLTQS